MFDVYAILVTEENVHTIVAEAAKAGWTLDHLQDNLEFYAEDGYDLMLYLKLFRADQAIANFNDIPVHFNELGIRPTDKTDPKFGIFVKYEEI